MRQKLDKLFGPQWLNSTHPFCTIADELKLRKRAIKSLAILQGLNIAKKRVTKSEQYMQKDEKLSPLVKRIPNKYFSSKKKGLMSNMYLVNPEVAESVAGWVMPFVKSKSDQVICETNAGLGLISTELLKAGLERIRIYESCVDFQIYLTNNIVKEYPGRVELFPKNIFQLNSLSYFDKTDNGGRVEEMLMNVPVRDNWSEDPVITIIGPMPNWSFIDYLMRMLVVRGDIVNYGRVQIFALMRPTHYVRLTAGPDKNWHTYTYKSVFFNLFFDNELLAKYSKKDFLPWESKKVNMYKRYADTVDSEYMYLVRINLKPKLPVRQEHLTQFYYFVKQSIGRGSPVIIQTVENWLPGLGINLICNGIGKETNLNVFTKFGELTPKQIRAVFWEMVKHPEYTTSPFLDLVENIQLKSESLETDLVHMKTETVPPESNEEPLQT